MARLPKWTLVAATWTATLLGSLPAAALPQVGEATPAPKTARPALFADNGKPKKVAKKSAKGVREKYLSGEAQVGKTKGKDSTKVDFDAADIGGERKTPLGTLINQNKADKNYDFVKIRLRWHPEMVQSASSLDAGSGN